MSNQNIMILQKLSIQSHPELGHHPKKFLDIILIGWVRPGRTTTSILSLFSHVILMSGSRLSLNSLKLISVASKVSNLPINVSPRSNINFTASQKLLRDMYCRLFVPSPHITISLFLRALLIAYVTKPPPSKNPGNRSE